MGVWLWLILAVGLSAIGIPLVARSGQLAGKRRLWGTEADAMSAARVRRIGWLTVMCAVGAWLMTAWAMVAMAAGR